ncbi:MAG: acetyl-coenzyme A synthetase N-terminal domain-containing protein, partial [Planctomycetota bacterium]|nr:acetyl-coenzyme A synthetase N-terminal domain-containing protein [Planctomycetota bacterium]
MSDEPSGGIDSVLHETRVFEPPSDAATRLGGAWIPDLETYSSLWRRSVEDPEAFWDEQAREHLPWFKT